MHIPSVNSIVNKEYNIGIMLINKISKHLIYVIFSEAVKQPIDYTILLKTVQRTACDSGIDIADFYFTVLKTNLLQKTKRPRITVIVKTRASQGQIASIKIIKKK